MSRQKYELNFKRDAVSLVLDQNYTRTQAASSLGISVPMLGRWIREHEAGDAFRGNGVMCTQDREVHDLKLRVKRLTAEAAILKKAVPLLAQPFA